MLTDAQVENLLRDHFSKPEVIYETWELYHIPFNRFQAVVSASPDWRKSDLWTEEERFIIEKAFFRRIMILRRLYQEENDSDSL